MKLTSLLRLADTELRAGDVTPVLLFPIGRWKSAKYHTKYPNGLPLTRETADLMVANFEANTLGIDVQFSIAGAHGLPAAAAFWVQGLKVAPYSWQGHEGEALWADAKWTQAGVDAANGDEFRYLSIEAGDFETPTGEIVPWVLQGGVLTNYPVIKIMPPVKDAANAIAAAEERTPELEISLTDLELTDESYNLIRDELEKAIADAFGSGRWVNDFSDSWVIYEASGDADAFHIYRVAYTRTNSGITFGQPVEVKRETSYVPVNAPQPMPSLSGGASGEPVAGSVSSEGVGGRLNLSEEISMSKLTEVLHLSEDAPDELILAEVSKVTAERDTALATLAEREKAERVTKLDAAIASTRVMPAEKEFLLSLAESSPATFDQMLAAREAADVKFLDTAEHGKGVTPPDGGAPGKNASVELAELTRARMAKDGVDFAKAKGLTLSENPNGIRERYDAFLNGHVEG